MDVKGAGSVGSAGRQHFPSPAARPAADGANSLQMPQDEVHISETARLLSQDEAGGATRADRLAQIKAAIANGTYETAEKLDVAVGRLLDDLR